MKRFIVLLCGVCMSFFAFSQSHIEVTLLDTRMKAVTDQPVILTNNAIGYADTAMTDDRGRAIFKGLRMAGKYSVFAPESDTHFESSAQDIKLRSNYNPEITLTLPVKSTVDVSEVVVSASAASRINTVNAEVASEMDSREIEEIPVEGRDITRMLYRLPHVTQSTGFFPEAPNVSINGANPLYNSYLIDGLDNNEQFLGGSRFRIPVGFASNVTVLTNNYSAEYGRTQNGIVNVTSKSGSNDITGEVFTTYRPGPALDASSPYAQRDLSGNPVKNGFQRYQGGFAVGGPIKKDQTFFFVNYEHTTDIKDNLLNSPQIGVNESIRGNNTFDLASIKIDHKWSDRWRSSLRANVGRITIDRQGGGLEGGVTFPSAANKQDRNSVNLAFQTTYTGDKFLSETSLQYATFRWNYARPFEDEEGPNVSVLAPDGSNIALIGNPGFVFDNKQQTRQVQQKFTWYQGNHTIKAGVDVLSTDHELFGGGNPNGSYTVQLNENQLESLAASNPGADLDVGDIPSDVRVTGYNIELRPSSFGTTQNVYSAYVEDAYQVTDRLNLTLGLRYMYDNLSEGGSDEGDYDNLAPRFSFNYMLDERSSLRGGYGIYYNKIVYAIYSDALQQNATNPDFKRQLRYMVDEGVLPEDTDIEAITFEGNRTVGQQDNSGLPFDYLDGPAAESFSDQTNVFDSERRILNPNGYDNPYTHQFSIGYQYQIDEQHLFYVDAVYNRGENLFRTRNLNAPAPWDYSISGEQDIARSTAWADSTRLVRIVNGAGIIEGDTLTGVARNVVMTETEGSSNYYGLSFNLQKDLGDGKHGYRITYTLSYLENNTEDINFRAMDANRFEAEWGPSINDRRHVINGIYMFRPLENLTLTVAALLQSGQPINRIPDASVYQVVYSDGTPVLDNEGDPVYSNDLNGDGEAFGDAYVGNSDRAPGESRNSDRLPWSNTFDVGISYHFPLGENGNKLEVRADVFNVFNAENLSGYSNNATQSNQIQVGPSDSGVLVRKNAGPPRQFQFSARYLF